MAASQAFKNRMNMRIDALKSQKSKVSAKLKEANLKVRAQRAMHTTGAFIGGGAAAVLDYEVEGFTVMETEIPVSAIAGAAGRIAAEVIGQDGGGADFLASTSDGMLAGATYRLVSDKYASWRTEE